MPKHPTSDLNRNRLNIALCSDSKFFEGLATCMVSIIAYSCQHTTEFNIFWIDGENRPQEHQHLEQLATLAEKKFNTQVNLHRIPFDPNFEPRLTQLKGSYTYYVRLLLAELIPDQNWIVWIDSDIFCMKDLSSISDFLDATTPVYGVVDPIVPTLAKDMGDIEQLNTRGHALDLPYINSGFMLLNLEIWRKEQLSKQLIDWAVQHSSASTFHDQSVINWNFADRIRLLPDAYNTFDASILAHATESDLESLPTFSNYHATGKNKLWMLDFKTTLKNAAQDFCRIVMTRTYLQFRETHLDIPEADRLALLDQSIRQHPYLKSYPSPLLIYNLKILYYTIIRNHRLKRYWQQSKAHYRKHASTICRIMRRISQEINPSSSFNPSN